MNSSEWDKFRKQQATEREQLQRLLFGIQRLLTKCRDTDDEAGIPVARRPPHRSRRAICPQEGLPLPLSRRILQAEEAGAICDEKVLRVRHVRRGEQSAIPIPPRSAEGRLELNLIIVIRS